MRRAAIIILFIAFIYMLSCIEPAVEGRLEEPAALSDAERVALHEALTYAFAPVMGRLQDDHLLLLAESGESGLKGGSRFRHTLAGAQGELLLSGKSGYEPYLLRIDIHFNDFVLKEGTSALRLEGMGKVWVTPVEGGKSYLLQYKGAADIMEGKSVRMTVPWELSIEADLSDIMRPATVWGGQIGGKSYNSAKIR